MLHFPSASVSSLVLEVECGGLFKAMYVLICVFSPLPSLLSRFVSILQSILREFEVIFDLAEPPRFADVLE